VPEWQLDHLSDLCHLLSAAANVIVADVVQFLLILSVNWLAFSIKHSAGSHNSELLGLSCHNLEFHRFEAASDQKQVSLLHRSVGIFEVRDEVGFCEVALYPLDGVAEGKHVDFGQIGHVSGRFDLHHIA